MVFPGEITMYNQHFLLCFLVLNPQCHHFCSSKTSIYSLVKIRIFSTHQPSPTLPTGCPTGCPMSHLHQRLRGPGSLQNGAAQLLQRRRRRARAGGGGVLPAQRQGAAAQGLAAQQQQLVGPQAVHQVAWRDHADHGSLTLDITGKYWWFDIHDHYSWSFW